MISEAYTPRCTCQDVDAAGYCPRHGFSPLPPLPQQPAPATPAAPPAHSRDYAQGLQRGFREGFDAALKLMGM